MFGGFHPMGLFSRGLCMEVLTKGFLSQKRKNPPGTKAPWVKNPLGQNPPIIIIRGFCPTFMFGGFCPKGFCLWGVLSGGFCLRGVLSQGGFVLPPCPTLPYSSQMSISSCLIFSTWSLTIGTYTSSSFLTFVTIFYSSFIVLTPFPYNLSLQVIATLELSQCWNNG